MDPFDIDTISGALAKASIDPAHWPEALETGARATGSFGCVLLPVVGHLPMVVGTSSMEQSLNAYVDDRWVDRDERYRAKAKFLRDGFATDDDCLPRDLRKRSPFYQDFIARCGLSDWAGVRIGRGANVWNLSLQRAAGQEPFSPAELSCLGRLSERLDPVVEVASALALSRGEASLDAFQFSGRAALLVDRAGSVVLANQAVETLVGPDLIISGGRIRSFHPKATDRLHLAFRALFWTQTASVLPVVFPKADGGKLTIYLMRTKRLVDSPLAAFHAILVYCRSCGRTVSNRTVHETAVQSDPGGDAAGYRNFERSGDRGFCIDCRFIERNRTQSA